MCTKIKTFGSSSLKHFSISLFDSGKSRADLWALSEIWALEVAAEKNNVKCGSSKPAPCPNQRDKSSPSCKINLPKKALKTGRADCVPSCTGSNNYPFCTMSKEVHPNPQGNGTETANFFKNHFNLNLNPREAIALMGAHTLGHNHKFNSLFSAYPGGGQEMMS